MSPALPDREIPSHPPMVRPEDERSAMTLNRGDAARNREAMKALAAQSWTIQGFLLLFCLLGLSAYGWAYGMYDIFANAPERPDAVHVIAYPTHGRVVYASSSQVRFAGLCRTSFLILLIGMPWLGLSLARADPTFRHFLALAFGQVRRDQGDSSPSAPPTPEQ
jgi:hypothetical protein